MSWEFADRGLRTANAAMAKKTVFMRREIFRVQFSVFGGIETGVHRFSADFLTT